MFEKFNNLFNYEDMKKSLNKILIRIVVLVLFWLVFYFLIDVKLWPWYEEQTDEKEFNSENFLDNLKVISWTIIQWPSQELYTQYGKFLNSTDKYLKLETYDFTNKFFKTWFCQISCLYSKTIFIQSYFCMNVSRSHLLIAA